MLALVCSVDITPCPAASQVWIPYSVVPDFAQLGITPAEVLQVFGWGVGSVLLFWSLGYSVGAVMTSIRRI